MKARPVQFEVRRAPAGALKTVDVLYEVRPAHFHQTQFNQKGIRGEDAPGAAVHNLNALKDAHAFRDLARRERARPVAQKFDRQPTNAIVTFEFSAICCSDQLDYSLGGFGRVLLDIFHEVVSHAWQTSTPRVVQQLLKPLSARVWWSRGG